MANDGTMVGFTSPSDARVDHHINDSFGVIIYDAIGSNDGILNGSLKDSRSADVPSAIGTGYSGRFDGIGQYVDCGNISPPSQITWAFWCYNPAANVGGIGAVSGTDGNIHWACYPGYSDSVLYWDYGDITGTGRLAVDYTAYFGKWTHVALTSDGSSRMNIYLDGVIAATSSYGDVPSGLGEFYIGRLAGVYFDGLIDDMRVYDSILSASDIAMLAAGNEPAVSPVSKWTFDETRSIPYLASSKAIEFEAGANKITHNAITYGAADAWSWAGWMKYTAAGVAMFFAGKDGSNSPELLVDSTAVLGFRASDTTITSGPSPEIDVWNHVVVTYDNSMIYFYVNGVQTGPETKSSSFEFSQVGKYAGDLPWRGPLTDPRIYNRALSAAEVLQLAEGTDVTDGLVWRLPMDDAPLAVPNVAGGYALEFDGSSYVDCGTDTALSPVNLTASFWLKADNLSSHMTLFDKYDAAQSLGWLFQLRIGGAMWFTVVGSGSSARAISSVTSGQWYYVVGTYDGSTARLYIDGTLASSASGAVSIANNNGSTIIGAGNVYTENVNGLIDDVRIYDTALSAADILGLYNGTDPSATPVSHWRFDDGPQFGSPQDGDPIATWQSRDGSRTMFIQPTATARPLLSLDANNKKWLDFDGSDDYLSISQALLSGTEGTIFVVLQVTDATTAFGVSDSSSAADYLTVGSNPGSFGVRHLVRKSGVLNDMRGGTFSTAAHVVCVTSDGATMRGYYDGTEQTITAASGSNAGDWAADLADLDATTVGGVLYGAMPSNLTEGKIARILAYERQLTADEIAAVSTKLQRIYGI